MDKILIQGGIPLSGSVRAGGAKNSALPILFSTILTRGTSLIRGVPHLMDVESSLLMLRELGMHAERRSDGAIEVDENDARNSRAPYHLLRKMRASICSLGPLLARRGEAVVSQPGGCVIGVRPIDLHLKGLRLLGARIEQDHGYIEATCEHLVGTDIYLGGPFGSTVLGTANVLMAASLAEGRTVIHHAACEPEIDDLAGFLNACGARISGAGTPRVEIEGVEELRGAEYTIIPDRIEAATFLIAGVMSGGDVRVEGARSDHLMAVIDFLRCAGARVTYGDGWVRARSMGEIQPVDVTTYPFPGFPTDLQAQAMALLTVADGISVITEKIYPDRFIHIAELNRMGARIRKEGSIAIISGVKELTGAQVMASDLRASASLVLAGLAAADATEVNRIYHIDRGYERIEEKLRALGAVIKRIPSEELTFV